MSRQTLKLGAVLVGVGSGSESELWRDPAVPLDASVNIGWYVQQAREAEAAKFDFVFIVDSQYITPDFPHHHLNRLEPLTLLSAVAVQTSRIGLVATVSTTYSEPFDIARRLASLDLISDGRAGWNIVTSQDPGTAGNFSRPAHGDYDDRYRRATEAVEVVQGLWQSYEEGAFARDRTAPHFLDRSKLHRLDHSGEYFSVTGPLNIQRSSQGQPPLVQAGTSAQGRALSARFADIVFSFARSKAESLELAHDIRAQAEELGRNPEDILFIPALSVTIGESDAEARQIEAERLDRSDLKAMLGSLSRQYGGFDFSRYALDDPFPDVPAPPEAAGISRFHAEIATVRQKGGSLRDVLLGQRSGWLRLVGSPATIAGAIADWYHSGAADGFNLFVQHPADWQRFREQVVPLLVKDGLFRSDYDDRRLRAHLGLPIARNAHAQRRGATDEHRDAELLAAG